MRPKTPARPAVSSTSAQRQRWYSFGPLTFIGLGIAGLFCTLVLGDRFYGLLEAIPLPLPVFVGDSGFWLLVLVGGVIWGIQRLITAARKHA